MSATASAAPARSAKARRPAARTRTRLAMPTTAAAGAIECRDSDPAAELWAGRCLPARQQAVLDRALAILGARLARNGPVFDSPSAVRGYICLQLGALPYEVFAVMFLDAQHRMIAFEQMFRGTLTQTSVYPREIVTQALMHGAAAVILAHNHPSGAPEPSQADISLTGTLKRALGLVDVRVLDHVVVAGNKAISMAEWGLV